MKYIRHKVVAEVASPGIYYIMTCQKADDKYFSICLQLGCMDDNGPTLDDAEESILTMISMYIRDVRELAEQGKRLLHRQASERYWAEFYRNVTPHDLAEAAVENFNMTDYLRHLRLVHWNQGAQIPANP